MGAQGIVTRRDFRAFVSGALVPVSLLSLARIPPRTIVRSSVIYAIGGVCLGALLMVLKERPPVPMSVNPVMLQVLAIVSFACAGFLLILIPCLLIGVPLFAETQPGVLGWKSFSLTPEGLREETRANDSLVRWAGINALDETDAHIFVRLDRYKMTGYVIPKRFFSDRETCAAFVAELRAGMTRSSVGNAQ